LIHTSHRANAPFTLSDLPFGRFLLIEDSLFPTNPEYKRPAILKYYSNSFLKYVVKVEYDIKRKLENSILPYIFSAYRLGKSRQYYLYHTYNYSKEGLSLLAGYGISSPIFKSMYDASSYNPVSTNLGIVGIIAGVLVGVFRLVAGSEDVTQSVIGQKKIVKEFRVINNNVQQALQKDTPEEALNDVIGIQQRVSAIVNTSIQEGIWTYNAISDQMRDRAKEETARLMSTFQNTWKIAGEEEAEQIPDQR
jgi:hypothetical protein